MIVRSEAPQTYLPEFKSILRPTILSLDNGVNIYSFNSGDQQVFRIELIFNIGSSDFENQSEAGILMKLLREGTKYKSAEEINDLLDYYGSFLDLKSGLDHSTITLFGRSEYINELVPLLAEIVLDPALGEDGLSKHKQVSIQNLQISQKKTSYWSSRLLRKVIYGENHPYSRIPSTQSIEEIENSSLINGHKLLLGSLAHIVIAGAFPENEMKSLISKAFSGPVIENQRTIFGLDSYTPQNFEKRIENSSQASIALGLPAISPSEEDFPVHSFITKILGGYFGSRLMKSLREDAGLTYGVHGYILQLLQGNNLQITSDVKLDAVDQSIEIISSEITKLLDIRIPKEEIDTVKSYMLGEYVNDSNTSFDHASLYKKIILQGLPNDYYDKFYQQISSLTPDVLEEKKFEVLDPEKLSIIKVY